MTQHGHASLVARPLLDLLGQVVTDAAQAHYAKRVSDAFQQAGSSVGEVGQQLSDWLGRQRGSAGNGPDDES